jgi:hypothetical protein
MTHLTFVRIPPPPSKPKDEGLKKRKFSKWQLIFGVNDNHYYPCVVDAAWGVKG